MICCYCIKFINMIKTGISFIFILMFSAFLLAGHDVSSQGYMEEEEEEEEKEKLENRFIIGGDFGLQFGTITLVNVSPMFGYRITKNFMTGLGFMYQYYSCKDHPYYMDYQTNIYGGSIFARYYIWNDLFAHAEYQLLSYEPPDKDKPVNVNSYLIGAGYRQWISNKFAAVIMVLFNLNENMYSPYSNPIIRIGFQGGL